VTARRLLAPSAATLVEVLTAGCDEADPLGDRLRAQLVARLSAVAPSLRGARRRLDAYSVERESAGFSTPFSWGTRAARRPIGTAAARSTAQGQSPDVLRAANAEVERLCDRAARGLTRPGSLGTWLASEPASVRSLCALEAATWAAGLLALVVPREAAGTPEVSVGVADAWFEVPGTGLTLVGRRDAVATSGPRASILRLRDGLPGARCVDGLLVDGLIEALGAPTRPLPARVVGAWPDAGLCVVVEFDDEGARGAARALLGAAGRLAPALKGGKVAVAA